MTTEISPYETMIRTFQKDIAYKIAKNICAYCAGTAVKCGSFNVESIGPIVPIEINAKNRWIQYTHIVKCVGYESPWPGIGNQIEQPCWAQKVWEVVPELIDKGE